MSSCLLNRITRKFQQISSCFEEIATTRRKHFLFNCQNHNHHNNKLLGILEGTREESRVELFASVESKEQKAHHV